MAVSENMVAVDMGGTNIRIGQVVSDHVTDIVSWPCRDFDSPATALGCYLETYGLSDVSLCMAIASPSRGDEVRMTNLDWSFSQQTLKSQLKLKHLNVINDYHGMSLAIPSLGQDDLEQIGGGEAIPGKPAVICGPGTGIGVGLLNSHKGQWVVTPSEGGHMDFAPNTIFEQDIWRCFHEKYGHVSIERILSGPGLEELYTVICRLNNQEASLSAAEISARAIGNECEMCHLSLSQFCAMLGSFCGSLALLGGAFGGVYITGGMIPKILDFFNNSEFRARFEDKGRYRDYLKRIPTLVVTSDYPGLIGAANYLRQVLAGPEASFILKPIKVTD